MPVWLALSSCVTPTGTPFSAPRFRPLPVAMGVDRSFAVLPVYFLPLKADEDGHAKRVKRRAELAASWQLRHASMGPAAGSQ